MKKIFVILPLLLLLNGCFSPLDLFRRAEKKVDKAEQAIAHNKDETIEQARGYIFAADYALGLDPLPSKFSMVGKSMTQRSLTTLGPPSMEAVLEYQKIINGLVSSNAVLVKKAEAALREKDAEVIGLQTRLNELEGKLSVAEREKDRLAEKHALMANKWSSLVKWIKWIVGGFLFFFVGGFLLKVAAVAMPALGPVASIIDSVLGGVGKMVFRISGDTAKKAAGVVDETYKDTLSDLVEAVQEIKTKQPETFAKIEPILKDKTSKNITRPVINKVKAELGHT